MSSKLSKFNADLVKAFIEGGAKGLRSALNKYTSQALYIDANTIQKSMEIQKAYEKVSDIKVAPRPTGKGHTPMPTLRAGRQSLVKFSNEFDDAIAEERRSTRQELGGKRISDLARQTFNQIKKVAKSYQGTNEYGFIQINPNNIIISGTFEEIQIVKRELQEEAERYFKVKAASFLANTTIGHAEAVSAIAARQVNDLMSSQSLTFASGIEYKALSLLKNAIIKVEGDLKLHNYINRNFETGYTITHTLEFEFNLGRGAKTSGFSEEMRKRLAMAIERSINRGAKYYDDRIEQLLDIKFSPSYREQISQSIEDIFLEKKLRNRRTLKRSRIKEKSKISHIKNPKISTLDIRGVTSRRRARRAPALFENLTSLKNIINANLHDILQSDVMGKGGAKELLNYQTGRFAMSARVLNLGLTDAGGALLADITWQHNPYDEFLPGGGPLAIGKPLRNPQLLIGRAVRIILRDLGLGRISRSVRTRIV